MSRLMVVYDHDGPETGFIIVEPIGAEVFQSFADAKAKAADMGTTKEETAPTWTPTSGGYK